MEEKIIKREVLFGSLKPAMKLLSPIPDSNGRPLIPKDTILTEKLIEKVREYFDGADIINKVWVEEKLYLRTEKEEKHDYIKKKIDARFDEYKNNKLYEFIKNLSVKAFDYLFEKSPDLYE